MQYKLCIPDILCFWSYLYREYMLIIIVCSSVGGGLLLILVVVLALILTFCICKCRQRRSKTLVSQFKKQYVSVVGCGPVINASYICPRKII